MGMSNCQKIAKKRFVGVQNNHRVKAILARSYAGLCQISFQAAATAGGLVAATFTFCRKM
jgi:hypothetical protein